MDGKLNRLQALLPAGLLVDAGWLSDRGYYSSLVAKYVSSGWLEQPTRGAYRRAGTTLGDGADDWVGVVLSLQRLRPPPPLLGGRTALEALGVALPRPPETADLHLYGRTPPPLWARRLLGDRLAFHRARLFADDPALGAQARPDRDGFHLRRPDREGAAGQVLVSTAERAFLELLDEVPKSEGFEAVDGLMPGLAMLDPARLSALLTGCRSVKVKRLALWFADRHGAPWAAQLERHAIDLGQGNRVLVPGGRLDKAYRITVPRELAPV